MRRVLLVFVLGLSLAGCASHKITPETPKAAAALKADAVVIRVNELQAVVIDACGPAPECQPDSLATATARQIVKTAIDLRTVLKAVPEGWQTTVKTMWMQAKARFVNVTTPSIVAAIAALDALIGGL